MEGEAPTSLVIIRDLPYHGMCPHHLLPYVGRATVAYLPGTQLVGFGRLGDLVKKELPRWKRVVSAAGINDIPAAVLERRHQALNVDRAELVRLVLAFGEADVFGVVPEPLVAERDPDAVRGGGPKESVELHCRFNRENRESMPSRCVRWVRWSLLLLPFGLPQPQQRIPDLQFLVIVLDQNRGLFVLDSHRASFFTSPNRTGGMLLAWIFRVPAPLA